MTKRIWKNVNIILHKHTWQKEKMYYTYGHWSRIEINCHLASGTIFFPCLIVHVCGILSKFIFWSWNAMCFDSHEKAFHIPHSLWIYLLCRGYDHFTKTQDYLFCIVNNRNGTINYTSQIWIKTILLFR